MKAHDRYLRFVRWEESDQLYVGYCPDLSPWGGTRKSNCYWILENISARATALSMALLLFTVS